MPSNLSANPGLINRLQVQSHAWITQIVSLWHARPLLSVLLLASLVIMAGIGLRDPWPADEPRFAQIAREMVESGQWFFPRRGSELYPDKPPLFIWSLAGMYWLTGSVKWSFLLPNAICSVVTVVAVYDLGRRLWSVRIGQHAALLLLLTLQFMLQAKRAQIDAMVCCWITLGCYGLMRFWLTDGRWRWYFFAWASMGLGVITKGVGFLPMLMLLPYLALRLTARTRTFPEVLPQGFSWRWLMGPLVFLSVIALWLLPMLTLVELQGGADLAAYRDNILFKQTVTRYADAWHHLKPFWYFIVSVAPVFWLPMSILLWWCLSPWKKAFAARDARIVIPLCWVVLVLVFFSLSPGKRGVYILPALPMLALAIAPYVDELREKIWLNRLLTGLVVLLASALLITGVAGHLELSFAHKLELKYEISPWLFFVSLGLIGLFASWASRKASGLLAWGGFILPLWVLFGTWGYTLMNPVRTPEQVYQQVQQHIPADSQLVLIDTPEQFMLFTPFEIVHFGYHTPVDEQLAAGWHWQTAHPKSYVLADEKIASQCYNLTSAIDVGFAHRVHWLLLPAEARNSDCPLTPASNSFQWSPR